MIDCLRIGRASTNRSFKMQVTLKCFRSILHQVLLCCEDTEWSCKLAQINWVDWGLYCLRGSQCVGKSLKFLARVFWLILMGRKGNSGTNLKFLGEYFSNHWTGADGPFYRAGPCQSLCAKYSALSRLWEKWKPRLGEMFCSAIWHFSLYWVRSFTTPLTCVTEV